MWAESPELDTGTGRLDLECKSSLCGLATRPAAVALLNTATHAEGDAKCGILWRKHGAVSPPAPIPSPQLYNPNQRSNTATNGGLIDRWGRADERRESLLQNAPCVCLSNGIRGREEPRLNHRQRGRSFSGFHQLTSAPPLCRNLQTFSHSLSACSKITFTQAALCLSLRSPVCCSF